MMNIKTRYYAESLITRAEQLSEKIIVQNLCFKNILEELNKITSKIGLQETIPSMTPKEGSP